MTAVARVLLNPLTSGNFADLRRLKVVEPFSGHCVAKKNPLCPKVVCKSRESPALVSGVCQILALEARPCAKGKNSLDFYFSLSLLRASFALLSPVFLFCWAFTRLHFRRKSFWGKPEDREISLKEVRVGSGTRFQWNFLVKITWFFGVLLWPVSLNGAHLPMV